MALDVRPEPTPNPNAVRFSFSAPVLGDKPCSFGTAKAAVGTPWAERLFAIPGVVSLFGMRDFLTITKAATADWNAIVPTAVEVLSKGV